MPKGVARNPEEKSRKLSLSMIGKNKGKTQSEETRRKISESLTGKKKPQFSDEHRRKISEALKGRTYSKSDNGIKNKNNYMEKMPDKKIYRSWKNNEWIVFSPWDMHCAHMPQVNGCYVIYLNGILSYIGQSSLIRSRFNQHHFSDIKNNKYISPWGEFDDMFCKIYFPKIYGVEAMMEKRLIRKLNPRFNRYGLKSKREELCG